MSDTDLTHIPTDAITKFDRADVAVAWRAMVDGQPFNRGHVRSVINDSWARCQQLDIDPRTHQAPRVETETFKEIRAHNKQLIEAAAVTWEVLAESLASSDNVVILADANGVTLEVSGNDELVRAAAEQSVGPGRNWHESAGGTNAVGTALALNQPVMVRSVEHYCEAAKIWDCAASPIRDLEDGTVLGVLDVTSLGDLSDMHSLALAITAAHQIEHILHSQSLARSVALLHWFRSVEQRWSGHAALLVDHKGRVVSANSKARRHGEQLPDAFEIVRHQPVLSPDSPHQIVERTRYEIPSELEPDGGNQQWPGGLLSLKIGAVRKKDRAPVNRQLPGVEPAFENIVTADPQLIKIMQRAARFARANSPVLLSGETGSGKELFARAIHQSSAASAGPFVAVNCGTFTKELAASELFGYEAGSFTGAAAKGRPGKFEQANNGTLFLDEIGELPLDVQVHLLRVMQDNVVIRVGGSGERLVSVRVIAATHRDLATDVANGNFRQDLYFRINGLALYLPPLRERVGDIPLLVHHCLRHLQEAYGLGTKSVSTELLGRLQDYAWPGNVRELHGILESIYILSDRPELGLTDLPAEMADLKPTRLKTIDHGAPRLEDIERDSIVDAISDSSNNLSLAARRLGISRSTLYRKIKQHDITHR